MFRGRLRNAAIAVSARGPTSARAFHASTLSRVQVGDKIPDIELVESSPGNKVFIAKELQGKGLIIGVPAAFSPSCSAKHIPGYINSDKLKSAGKVFVVSVNDPFVYVPRSKEGGSAHI